MDAILDNPKVHEFQNCQSVETAKGLNLDLHMLYIFGHLLPVHRASNFEEK